MNSFISISDHSPGTLLHILHRADEMYDAWMSKAMPASLAGKRVALWFYGSGFRNRMGFEIGARAMGADVSYIPGELGIQEPLEDIGPYLDNWFDVLVVRASCHRDLLYLDQACDIPVINARTDFNHPCEIMGDLQYIRRTRGSLEDLHVVFVGEVTNLCMSWFAAAQRFPIYISQVAPADYLATDAVLETLKTDGTSRISIAENLDDVIDGADVLYTDCWPKSANKNLVREAFLPYQIATSDIERMNPHGAFLPCPPVTRGEEVSSEAMCHPLCKNREAKAFLLHAQNAIMEYAVAANHG